MNRGVSSSSLLDRILSRTPGGQPSKEKHSSAAGTPRELSGTVPDKEKERRQIINPQKAV
jgi:hypothetical protein